MTLYRCQNVLQSESGLPADVFCNTFWLEDANATPSVAQAELAAEKVRDFYTTTAAGNTAALHMYYGDQVALTGHQVRVSPIDVETGEDERGIGQPPYWTETYDHLGLSEPRGNGLPSELAVCMSFRNTSSSSVPPARRRGRIYFGPIMAQAGLGAPEYVTADVPRVQTGFVTFLRRCGDALRTNDTNGLKWVVYSRPFAGRGEIVRPGRTTLPALPARDGSTYEVTQVWVDNAYDIQRRRGEKATVRELGAVG